MWWCRKVVGIPLVCVVETCSVSAAYVTPNLCELLRDTPAQ